MYALSIQLTIFLHLKLLQLLIIMKIVSLLLLLFVSKLANANTYYFSTNSGDDSRSFDEAQNPSTPWKTLRKLNNVFSSLKPGDAVLLKRGETFYGSIDVSKSGAKGSPIVIGDYGTGDKPVITSLVKLTKWVSKGNGIWESYNGSLGSNVSMVLINGEEQELGRFPNSNANNKGYLNFETHAGRSSITDANFSLNKNWKGAEVVIRSRRWVLDRNIIISNTRNKIVYKASSQYPPYDYQGYFIQNDIKTLDKFGEWYYNPSTHKLSVFFGSVRPSSYTVQAPAYNNLISSQKYSNIVFTKLAIIGANGTGVNIKFGSNITIQECDIKFSGQNGVDAKFHPNFTIKNSTISNSNNSGIDLGYSGDYATIRNNKITNTYIFAGLGRSGDGHGLGIQSNGNGSIIEYNEIRNTGYIGLNFSGNDVTIKNNLVDNFCRIKDDGAGIYSHTGSSKSYSRRKVIGNIILNGLGAPEGTSNPSYYPAEGIYMDNDASNVEIRENTVANCKNNGIYIHNAYGMAIRNNTIFNNGKQLNVIEDADHSRVRKCEFTNNIFFSKSATQYISFISASADDVKLFGNFNNNYYARPLNANLGIFSTQVKQGKRIGGKLDLEDWKNKYGQDKASKDAGKEILPYKVNQLKGSDKVTNGTFLNSINQIHKSSCNVSWSNKGILDGGFLKIDPKSKQSSVSMKIGGLQAGKKYVLRYSSKGTKDGFMTLGAFLRQDGGSFRSLTSLQSSKVLKDRSENEIVFSPSSSVSSAWLAFEASDKETYYLDNIKLYEADVSITDPDKAIIFKYNASSESKKFSLDGNYVDVKGRKFSNSITLQPYTSVVLMENGNKKAENPKNAAPIVNITSPGNKDKFTSSSTINITAKASDKDGTIYKVEFYNGKTLLATEYSSPYTYAWKNVTPGRYIITAVATDNDKLKTTSDKVEVTVETSKAPTVSITKPIDKQKFKEHEKIRLIAKANDSDGRISKVEFYSGNNLLRTEYKYPYTYWWKNVRPGNYTVTAIATDNYGLRTKSESVKVTVEAKKQKKSLYPGNEDSSIQRLTKNDANDSISSSSAISLKLSPNPASNFLNITTAGLQQNLKTQVSIISISGAVMKTVQSNPSNQIIQLDISSLSPGIYIVKVVGGDKILSKQFVKL